MTDDFEKIILTDEEKQVLKELDKCTSKNKDDIITPLNELTSLGFITYVPGLPDGYRMKASQLICAKITDRGRRYLIYLNNREQEKAEELHRDKEKVKKEFCHDWKIAIFSSLAGALLSEPLWSAIEWALEFFKMIIQK